MAMFESEQTSCEVLPSGGAWRALHTQEPLKTPAKVALANDDDGLFGDCYFYLDAMSAEHALVSRVKGYRKGGAAIVEERGKLPFGNQLRFFHTAKYASNHMRVTADFDWPRDTMVQRHFGVDGLFLPGDWRGYRVIPAILHLQEHDASYEVALPEWPGKTQMVGHWHRPPLSIVFTRADGVQLEIGTGMDVWRWEHCLGAHPESGSFKIIIERDGLRFIREPLMTCTPFTPPPRQYRFKWYAAWNDRTMLESLNRTDVDEAECARFAFSGNGEIDWNSTPAATDGQPWLLDFRDVQWPKSAGRDGDCLNSGSDAGVCWQSSAVIRLARRIFRQIQGGATPGKLLVKGVNVGWCLNASHLERGGKNKKLRHWDIDGILDLAVWARQVLGDTWDIQLDPITAKTQPVLAGLFKPNGFETELTS